VVHTLRVVCKSPKRDKSAQHTKSSEGDKRDTQPVLRAQVFHGVDLNDNEDGAEARPGQRCVAWFTRSSTYR
jgi:hypothetical protein